MNRTGSNRWGFESNRDWTLPCVVAGQFRTGSTVEWFVLLDVVVQGLADVGYVAEQSLEDGFMTTRRGYRVPTAVTSTDCGMEIGEPADADDPFSLPDGASSGSVRSIGDFVEADP